MYLPRLNLTSSQIVDFTYSSPTKALSYSFLSLQNVLNIKKKFFQGTYSASKGWNFGLLNYFLSKKSIFIKKLKLRFLHLGDAEVLTREQLKKIIGGEGSGYALACRTSACSGYDPIVKRNYSGTCGKVTGPGPQEQCMCTNSANEHYVHTGCSY